MFICVLSAEQVFRIYIADKNDHSPEFDKTKYIAVISEDVDIGSNVIELKATDIDAGTLFSLCRFSRRKVP